MEDSDIPEKINELVKAYKHYGLYITKTGYKECFNLDGIRREMTMKKKS